MMQRRLISVLSAAMLATAAFASSAAAAPRMQVLVVDGYHVGPSPASIFADLSRCAEPIALMAIEKAQKLEQVADQAADVRPLDARPELAGAASRRMIALPATATATAYRVDRRRRT